MGLIKAAEAMVKCLENEGIKVVFGYPGAAICPFYDELSHSDIKHILVRHEANGGHSASGYARITGKPAVCIATSGPGATNLLTAIATAYMDSVPIICITGQVCSDQIGCDVFQEADITGAAEPFVKYSYLVKNAQDIPRIFKEAFHIAGTGRPGPVLIDVPMDVQQTMIDFEYPETVSLRSYKPSAKGNALQIKKVAEAIKAAEKPLICAGGGIFLAHAEKEIKEFAELTGIPVVSTMMGLSVFPTDHPLYFGMIGMHGVKTANHAVGDCDLMILIGARVGDRAVKSPSWLEENTKIIHIDIDPAEIGKNIHADIPLVGDCKCVLAQLNEIMEKQNTEPWLEHLREYRSNIPEKPAEKVFTDPKGFLKKLSEAAPDNTVAVADVGQNQIWACNNFKVKNGRFLTSGGMGTMGYSVPCAVGAKLADPSAEVIVICGDGSFQMQMMELATICQYNVPVKIVLMRNEYLGMVRELQTRMYADNRIAVSLGGDPDFVALAKAYGISAERVENNEQADEAIKRFLASDKPYLLEVMVNETESTL